MIPCNMFLRDHFRNTSIIDMVYSGRVIVGGLGDAY